MSIQASVMVEFNNQKRFLNIPTPFFFQFFDEGYTRQRRTPVMTLCILNTHR